MALSTNVIIADIDIYIYRKPKLLRHLSGRVLKKLLLSSILVTISLLLLIWDNFDYISTIGQKSTANDSNKSLSSFTGTGDILLSTATFLKDYFKLPINHNRSPISMPPLFGFNIEHLVSIEPFLENTTTMVILRHGYDDVAWDNGIKNINETVGFEYVPVNYSYMIGNKYGQGNNIIEEIDVITVSGMNSTNGDGRTGDKDEFSYMDDKEVDVDDDGVDTGHDSECENKSDVDSSWVIVLFPFFRSYFQSPNNNNEKRKNSNIEPINNHDIKLRHQTEINAAFLLLFFLIIRFGDNVLKIFRHFCSSCSTSDDFLQVHADGGGYLPLWERRDGPCLFIPEEKPPTCVCACERRGPFCRLAPPNPENFEIGKPQVSDNFWDMPDLILPGSLADTNGQ